MHNLLRISILFIVNTFALHLCAQNAELPSPKVSVQGTLKDANGTAVGDGFYEVRFDLFTNPTGGQSKWNETDTVEIADGIYSQYIGVKNPLEESLFDSTLFLAVTVGEYELSPRTELAYAPYTFAANNAFSANEVICSGAVGDVKYSILNPTQFAQANGDCWVPMDGRNIINTKLSAALDIFSLPDASGLFLRAQEFENGADNDPNRSYDSEIGVVQDFKMLAHNHTFETYTGDKNNNTPTYSNIASDKTSEGAHSHLIDKDSGSAASSGSQVRADDNNCPTCPHQSTHSGGSHQHRVAGTTNMSEGSSEVRPINASLYVYVRIN